MDALIAFRKQVNATSGLKTTITDFLIKACAKACSDVPATNSQFHGEILRKFKNVDISVAVDIGDGLITPIIKQSDTRTLSHISKDLKELVVKAKEGRLLPNEY